MGIPMSVLGVKQANASRQDAIACADLFAMLIDGCGSKRHMKYANNTKLYMHKNQSFHIQGK